MRKIKFNSLVSLCLLGITSKAEWNERVIVKKDVPLITFKELKLNNSYVNISNGFENIQNHSVLVKFDLPKRLEMGVETFYNKWNNDTLGAGIFATKKIDYAFSLYGDYYLSDKGNDLAKNNFGIGLIYDHEHGNVFRTIYRNKRFRNNQSVDTLNFEYIKYYQAEINYYSVSQLALSPEYINPGNDFGYIIKAVYTYGKVKDWRVTPEIRLGESNYLSVIDKVTENSNNIWGISVDFGKHISNNLELGVHLDYTDSDAFTSKGIMLKTNWTF